MDPHDQALEMIVQTTPNLVQPLIVGCAPKKANFMGELSAGTACTHSTEPTLSAVNQMPVGSRPFVDFHLHWRATS
jgi:hypothetical protein